MRGSVSVDSTVGAGSCFSVRLPLSIAPLDDSDTEAIASAPSC